MSFDNVQRDLKTGDDDNLKSVSQNNKHIFVFSHRIHHINIGGQLITNCFIIIFQNYSLFQCRLIRCQRGWKNITGNIQAFEYEIYFSVVPFPKACSCGLHREMNLCWMSCSGPPAGGVVVVVSVIQTESGGAHASASVQ